MSLLKPLFGSNTRVKILRKMYEQPDRPYFVRELTREVDEQINSVRRELLNLKKIGLLSAKSKNRKKYFQLNKHFVIYHELRNIFTKTSDKNRDVAGKISRLGDVQLLALAGIFVGDNDAPVDMLVVGDINRDALQELIINEFELPRDLRYSLLTEADLRERLQYRDKFIIGLLTNPNTILEINTIDDELEENLA